MPHTIRTSCLAGIDRDKIPLFETVLKNVGLPVLASVARVDVADLGARHPDLLVCDVDGLIVDALEILRQVRFVLPECIIMVYTRMMKRSWSRECHLAGANGILLEDSTIAEIALGVRSALRTGCFTDPRFAAA